MYSTPLRCSLSTVVLAIILTIAATSSASAAGRITNGKPVSSGAFDARWGFVVSLQFSIPEARPSDRGMHMCGGSLIAPDIVVTAEHCVPVHARMLPFGNARLQVLARHRTLKASGVTRGDRVDVTDIWHYPNVDPRSSVPAGDVALLKLARPIDAPTIRLVGAEEAGLWGAGAGRATGAWTAGWGITEPNRDDASGDDPAVQTQAQLREVSIPLVADSACESSDSSMRIEAGDFDPRTMLCGGSLDTRPGPSSSRRGACNGDSGGPLIVADAVGGWRLAGIVSWGPALNGGCNSRSVFTRVDAVRDWIEQTVAAGGPVLAARAPRVVGVQTKGVNELVVQFGAGIDDARRRVMLVREFNARESVIDLGNEPIDLRSIPVKERAEARAMQRASFNEIIAVGGRSTTQLVARGVAPRRPGQSKRVRLRLVTEGTDGQLDVGRDVLVQAPIDAVAPARPKAPRSIGVADGAVRLWWPKVRDNDCVGRYLIEVREHGASRWRAKDGRPAGVCTPLDRLVSGSRPSGPDRIISGVLARLLGRPNDVRLTGMRPGVWQVRVVAVDRAGNRTAGAAATVRVPRLARMRDTADDDAFSRAFDEAIKAAFPEPAPGAPNARARSTRPVLRSLAAARRAAALEAVGIRH